MAENLITRLGRNVTPIGEIPKMQAKEETPSEYASRMRSIIVPLLQSVEAILPEIDDIEDIRQNRRARREEVAELERSGDDLRVAWTKERHKITDAEDELAAVRKEIEVERSRLELIRRRNAELETRNARLEGRKGVW